eukprot:3828742-Pleurochrysis_carterae.AAC.1
MGWYMAPKYVVDNLSSFQPVDSMDAAHFKSPGTGYLLSRVTPTEDKELVAMGTAHFLLGESNWTVKAFLRAEKKVYGNALNSTRRITIVDGGVALNSVHAQEYPQVNLRRCQRHLTQDLKRRGKAGDEACAFPAEMGVQPRARLAQVDAQHVPAPDDALMIEAARRRHSCETHPSLMRAVHTACVTSDELVEGAETERKAFKVRICCPQTLNTRLRNPHITSFPLPYNLN